MDLFYYSYFIEGGRYFQLANSKRHAYNHARKIAQDVRFGAPVEVWQKNAAGELVKIDTIKE